MVEMEKSCQHLNCHEKKPISYSDGRCCAECKAFYCAWHWLHVSWTITWMCEDCAERLQQSRASEDVIRFRKEKQESEMYS